MDGLLNGPTRHTPKNPRDQGVNIGKYTTTTTFLVGKGLDTKMIPNAGKMLRWRYTTTTKICKTKSYEQKPTTTQKRCKTA